MKFGLHTKDRKQKLSASYYKKIIENAKNSRKYLDGV